VHLNASKISNVWCGRLASQALRGKINEVEAEEAQMLANMGYTVVAAWRNIEKRDSPHFATVRPGYEYHPVDGPMVANVGENIGVMRGKAGCPAPNQLAETRWFYNPEQVFRCYLKLINIYRDRIL
jgi:hypothetical protein